VDYGIFRPWIVRLTFPECGRNLPELRLQPLLDPIVLDLQNGLRTFGPSPPLAGVKASSRRGVVLPSAEAPRLPVAIAGPVRLFFPYEHPFFFRMQPAFHGATRDPRCGTGSSRVVRSWLE